MIYLPKDMPAVRQLRTENLAAEEWTSLDEALHLTTAKRILFLNLMPQKQDTEWDISRTIAQGADNVCLLPMKISGQRYKTTPTEYVERFYTNFEHFEQYYFDGLIVTGAPLEQLPFEDVRYWQRLQHIMDWAVTHVRSTLYICWAAQAGLYHHYGVPKHALPEKKFGIYLQTPVHENMPLLENIANPFPMPHSRHTEVRMSDLLQCHTAVKILAESPNSGASIIMGSRGHDIYVTGHLEYEPYTLHREYLRDLSKGLPISQPVNYYVADNPHLGVDYSWRDAATRFYANWVRYYCT